MKKILNLFSILTLSTITILQTISCDFFNDNTKQDKPFYQYEEWFNGTSSAYQDDIVKNVNIMSWRKYASDWQTFTKKYKKISFDDNSIIEVATPNYENSCSPSKLVGVDLAVNISQIGSIDKKDENKIWNIKFGYSFLWSVKIELTAYAFFWYDNDNGNIYLTVHLNEYSRSATQGAHFKIIINNFSCISF